jgi:MFS family permease
MSDIDLEADFPAARLRPRAERALDVLSFVLSDVRYGLGAYLGVYLLTEHAWDPASIGLALSFGGLVGLVSQVPLGAMVDALRAKRALIAGAVAVVTATCLAIPLAPRFWPVAVAGVVGGLAGTTIGPCLAAISLGIVGPARFARRAGRNESLFHLGNGAINLVILATAPVFGTGIVFWMMGLTAVASAAAAWAVPERAINHDVARGFLPDAAGHGARPSPWSMLLTSRPLLVFAGCGALFHLANAAMLGLVAQKLAVEHPGQGIAFTAACAITAQAVMVPTAALAGRRADVWGRKPLLLAAFAALALRGALYTVSDNPAWLLGVQLLDGVGAGLVGALFPVVVADLTRGSGHFNAAGGAVGTVHAVGGIVSGALAGEIVVLAGYQAAFLALAAIAVLGAALFWMAMPETRAPVARHPR